MFHEETIAAQSSAAGAGFRGIVRISGPAALEATASCFEPALKSECRHAVLSGVLNIWGRPIPARLFFWPEGRSYTGKMTVELHTLGSPPILDALLDVLCRYENVRLARPGEFTLQAFLTGQLDLTQAEAVLGIIDAPNESALQAALQQLAGGMTTPIQGIRQALFDMLAHIEAGLDFADEDIELISANELQNTLDDALAKLTCLRNKMNGRHLSHAKPVVALVGPPNAGKSSLFNALLKRNAAIVSPMPGTTRDYLEAEFRLKPFENPNFVEPTSPPALDFAGRSVEGRCTGKLKRIGHTVDDQSFLLIDTAGVDDKLVTENGEPDIVAQKKSKDLREQADVVLECREFPEQFQYAHDVKTITVRTKYDILYAFCFPEEPPLNPAAGICPTLGAIQHDATGISKRLGYTLKDDCDDDAEIAVSAKTGHGLSELRNLMAKRIRTLNRTEHCVPSTAARCRASLHGAEQALLSAQTLLTSNEFCDESLVAAEIRVALSCLADIDGSDFREGLFDHIFSKFCIGK